MFNQRVASLEVQRRPSTCDSWRLNESMKSAECFFRAEKIRFAFLSFEPDVDGVVGVVGEAGSLVASASDSFAILLRNSCRCTSLSSEMLESRVPDIALYDEWRLM